MIKQLATFLEPPQMDLLFGKFEIKGKGRSLADTLRLLDLLRKLAQSDSSQEQQAGSMAGKLLQLVWDLTMPADAPPELLDSRVMVDVLEGYHQEVRGGASRCGAGAPAHTWPPARALRWAGCVCVCRCVFVA